MTSILFVRLSAMGDLVHGLGAVQALHRVRHDWRLTVVTQATFAPLLEGVPGVARVVTFARRGGLRAVADLRSALREDGYDVALDLQGNWKSASVARLSGAAQRWGAGARWRQEPRSRILLTRTIDVPGERHPALVGWALVRELAPDVPFLAPVLRATPAELAAETAALGALGIEVARPFRLIVVTDPRDPRALRSGVVAAEAVASPEPVVHLLGPAEAGLELPAGGRVLRHGAGALRRLVALGAIVARSGGVVVGPDQGACHVLAAAGARCLVSFGAQDPVQTAPPGATALVHPAPPRCSPCRSRTCTCTEGPICMDFTSADGRLVTTGLPQCERV